MSVSSVSYVAFSSERKNLSHLSHIRALFWRGLPPTSRMYRDSTFFVSSGCTYLMVWKNLRWSPMQNYVSNSNTQSSKKRTTVAFCAFFGQLHACLTAFCSCAFLVSIFNFRTLPGCVYRTCCIGVSTPTPLLVSFTSVVASPVQRSA